jgi:hypothetical protein
MKTDSFLFIVFVLVSSVFADTIYLRNGEEVKNAVITDVGISNVKYKIGQRETVYTKKKTDIVLIIYDDGTKDMFSDEDDGYVRNNSKQESEYYESEYYYNNSYYNNFTTGERVGTWALNAFTISGLGSWVIMRDIAGGFIHFGLDVATIVFYFSKSPLVFVSFVGGAGWNIYRSATYEDPRNVTYSKYGNFNMAILPSRYGNFNAYLMYNKIF